MCQEQNLEKGKISISKNRKDKIKAQNKELRYMFRTKFDVKLNHESCN